MSRVYLHIGVPKTGTTALQDFCFTNRAVLMKHGVYYPDCGTVSHQPLVLSWSENVPPMNSLDWGSVCRIDEEWDKIYKIVKDDDVNVLISTESLSGLSITSDMDIPLELRRYLKGLTVYVIVYIRQQDQLLQSIWNQYAKMPEEDIAVGLDEFIENPVPFSNYQTLLERWERVFGKENLIVRLYDKNVMHGGDIFSDFLHTMGIELTDEFQIPEINVNPVANSDFVEFMIIAKSQGLFGLSMPVRRLLTDVVRDFFDIAWRNSPEFKKHTLLSPYQRTNLLKMFEESNRYVAANYFNENIDRIYPVWPDPDEEWISNSNELKTEQLKCFLESIISKLLVWIRMPEHETVGDALHVMDFDKKSLVRLIVRLWSVSHGEPQTIMPDYIASLPPFIQNLWPTTELPSNWNPKEKFLVVRMAPVVMLKEFVDIIPDELPLLDIITQSSSKQSVENCFQFKDVYLIPDGPLCLSNALEHINSNLSDVHYDKCVIIIHDVHEENFYDIVRLVTSSTTIHKWYAFTDDTLKSGTVMRIPVISQKNNNTKNIKNRRYEVPCE